MLDTTTRTQRTTEPQETIDGRSLSYQLRYAPAPQRVAWAKQLVIGEKRIGRFTRTQAAAICGVSLPAVSEAVKNGKKKESHASAICVTWWQQASFSDRVDFVRACGVSEVWDAISTAVAE